MTLYEIVKALQSASGSNAKQAILEQYKDNELLKAYLKAVYDPAINYYQTKLPDISGWKDNNFQEFCQKDVDFVLDELATRKVTGYEAVACLGGWASALNKEGRELMSLLIKRSIGAGVGDTMILKVFPELYFIPPYQRCSLMDDKIKAKFENLETFIVQEKLDGSFCYLVKEAGKAPEAITRAGSKYPKEFAEKLTTPRCEGFVVIGELVVIDYSADDEGVLLDRKTGNGILNSILKGGGINKNLEFKLVAWDCINTVEFSEGFSKDPYYKRLEMLELVWETPVRTRYVKSLDEAYQIYSKFTSNGSEGCVIKTKDFKWSNGTSKDCIKLKIEFEMDLRVIGITEGAGKAKGMMGSLTVSSSDGKIVCDIGTGFSDNERMDWWLNSEERIGTVVSVKANDIIFRLDSKIASLFLPVYVDHRLDKSEADSYERCVEQLEAAKNGGK